MVKLDFTKPNSATLMQIDFYFQNEKRTKAWDRSGVPDCYCGESGWDWVEENYPKNFLRAWHLALAHILSRDIEFQTIENYEGED